MAGFELTTHTRDSMERRTIASEEDARAAFYAALRDPRYVTGSLEEAPGWITPARRAQAALARRLTNFRPRERRPRP